MLRLSVISCAVAVANAKWFNGRDEPPSWQPAEETQVSPDLATNGWTPKPTPAPGARFLERELAKRASTNTCGYYAGYSSSAAVICQNAAQCIVNDSDMAMGCCRSSDIQDCQIATVCIESASASRYTGLDSYAIFCTSSEYPSCVTYSYDNFDPLYAGYSALGCGAESGVYSVEYYPPALGSAVSGSSRRTSKTSTRTSASVQTTGGSLTSKGNAGATGKSSTTTGSATGAGQTTSPTAEPAAQPSGPNTGAIVGGVVGGLAGLALIVTGIFLLVRHSQKNKDGGAPPPGPPAQTTSYYAPGPGPDQSVYGQPPPMDQTQHYAAYAPAGFAAVDNRSSMAPSTYFAQSPKPSQYDNSISVSPTGSPPPQSVDNAYQGAMAGYTPPPGGQQQPQYQAYTPPPAQQYQAYNPHTAHAHAHELPTSRPDEELRELA
ncbi:uncharacterized protein JN550_008872 [Neoarthrinium moseri]|uniref:uncharacterized protein n=1 Tax=Neoarthrinium moseri TaxID=1658444 RepID=UPI001FDC0799|nr:uncharacterized protein JN550_008872 [Neoarthrinium moseri]KAI1864585.1 hypothetical protein JN550_008872 [Neoarthrinium moseri]